MLTQEGAEGGTRSQLFTSLTAWGGLAVCQARVSLGEQ